MNRSRLLPVLAAAALLASCAGRDQDAARATLIRTDTAFAQAAAARGLDGWLAFFADDATIFPAGGGIVTGLDAIRAHYRATGFTPEGLSWQPRGAEAAESGDLGYTFGTWTLTRAADKAVVSEGTYVTVWRREGDGGWKVVADMGSGGPPQP